MPTQRVAPVGAGMGHSHSCCLKGGWDCRTEIKMKKRKRGHRSSMASWIWGTLMVGGVPVPISSQGSACPCARTQQLRALSHPGCPLTRCRRR